MDDLLAALVQRAAEYDIEMLGANELQQTTPKALVRLTRNDQSQQYFTLLSPHMQLPDSYAGHHWTGPPLLVLGARVTPRSAERFRELGINFIDANGNAYFRFGNVLVDVRGRTGDPLGIQYRDKPTMSNLFSPKRSQVIFALISWPDLVNAKLREIADVAGVSVGFVQRTLADLEVANYLAVDDGGRGRRKINDLGSLIDGWVASFRSTLGSAERTRAFRGDFDPTVLPADGPDIYVSGEGANDWIRRNSTWTLYCNEIPREAATAGRWAARSNDPNIFLRPVFWTEPPHSQVTSRIHKAPPLLVYADLIASGESRQREAAEPRRIMLVGARCRDVLHTALGHSDFHRATLDLDLGVALSDWSAFERVDQEFPRTGSNGIRYVISGLPVDIMPFGSPIEDPSGVSTPASRSTRGGLVVFGFENVFERAATIDLPGTGHRIKIPTPAGYAALKTRAWVDRSADGEYKDAEDLALVLRWYYNWQAIQDRLFGDLLDIVELYEFDIERAAAHLLGVDVRDVLSPSNADDLAGDFARSEVARFASHIAVSPADVARGNDIGAAFQAGLSNP